MTEDRDRWFKQQYADPLPPSRHERAARAYVLGMLVLGVVIGLLAGLGMAYVLGLIQL